MRIHSSGDGACAAASLLPGPGRPSSLTRRERSLVGVARWPGECNGENDRDQQSYGRSFWRATREAGLRISEGQVGSFRELWSLARDWRSRRAGGGARGFDTERVPGQEGMFTPLNGVYEYLRDRYATRTDGVIEESVVPALPPSRRFRMEDDIDGRPIALTSIVMSTDPRADRESRLVGILQDAGLSVMGAPFHIDHTAPPDVPRVMAHAESLYSRALDPSVSNAEALATLGELHWWVAHAMPDDRGSAAKTELAVRSMAQSRGMDLPPFRKGFVPDLEAMTTPRAEFVERYAAMFDGRPGPGQPVA
jgi:avirulence protein